jgi:hypothetical protein
MIIFDRRKGTIFNEDGSVFASDIYSGYGLYANKPEFEREIKRGPLPAAIYTIGHPYQHQKLGPFVMNLDPVPGTGEQYGRSAFRIHGDNSTPEPFDGSHGCIIANRKVREKIDKLTDRRIKVV